MCLFEVISKGVSGNEGKRVDIYRGGWLKLLKDVKSSCCTMGDMVRCMRDFHKVHMVSN